MANKILLLFIFLVGCNDRFPSDHIFNVDQKAQTCDRYYLDQENIKFKFDKSLPFNECPNVYGFEQDEIGKITAWLRRNKKKLEECGKSI